MRSRSRINEPALLAVCGLALATSCTPGLNSGLRGTRAGQAVPPAANASALLRRLALHVPADVAADRIGLHDDLRREVAAVPVAAPPFLAPARSADDAARAADCLTAAVYYEARSEPLDGQRAVAQVVLNRVRDRAFPDSVCGVVFQHPARGPGCQFSFACDGAMDRPRDWAAWDRASAVAAAALAGEVYAPVGAATYYHAASVLPWWAAGLARVGAIGAHIFYRWHDGMARALAFRQAYAGIEQVAGGPAAMGSAQAGVTVHRGMTEAGGVVLHYGTTDTASVPAPASATDEGGERAPQDPGRVRGLPEPAVAGVTVHVGTARQPLAATPADPG